MKKVIVFVIACLTSSVLLANHWTPETGDFQFYMPLTSVVQIDGIEQSSDQLEVGVFCGEQCRDSKMVQYWQIEPAPGIVISRYVVYLSIYGTDGEQMSFKLYDHNTNQELDLTPPDPVAWTQNPAETYTEANPYILNFTSSTSTLHWTPETGNFQFYMPLTSVVQIDGIEQSSDQLEVGVFCGEQCRDSKMVQYWQIEPAPGIVISRYVVYLSIYGTDGEQMSFKLYDHSTNQELNLTSPDPVAWTQYPSETYTETNPYILNFTSSAAQTFTLPITGYGNSAGGYCLIAPPFDDIDPEEITGMTEGDYDLYYFDESQAGEEWRNYEAEPFHLESGKGYLYAHKTDISVNFTGIPYSGDGQVTLSRTEGKPFTGWNLVGNPFAQTATIDRDCYVMKADGTEIIAGNTRTVNPMQGVFVIAAEEGETLTFIPENNVDEGARIVIDVLQGRGASTGSAAVDRAIVHFEGNGTLPKFMLNPSNTKLYIPAEDADYAVTGHSVENTTPVSFKASHNGTYTLSFDIVNLDLEYLHLIDNKTGDDIDLLAQKRASEALIAGKDPQSFSPTYTFEALTTDYAERFKLVYATANVVEEAGKPFAYYANGEIHLFETAEGASLEVVDMKGRVLVSYNGRIQCVPTDGMASGVYVLRLINGDETRVQKIVIK